MPIRNVQKSRCLTIFENSIQSEETKKNYLLMLDKYRKWVGVEDFDELLKADSRSIQRLLEDYVLCRLKTNGRTSKIHSIIPCFSLKHSSQRIYFSGISCSLIEKKVSLHSEQVLYGIWIYHSHTK